MFWVKIKRLFLLPPALGTTPTQVDRYAKFGTEHLTTAVARVERGRDGNVIDLSRFCHVPRRSASLAQHLQPPS
ncbi:MAG: hypothetical protein E6H78_14375 [Betaproteobacteria bacterium]|nr:MAG: hypothetical protein E6H78_14375 [Betaproteobacteria bacterium]